MKTRMLTGSEMLLAHCLWGPGLYPALRKTRIIGERFSHDFIDELVDHWGFRQPESGQEPVDGAILTLVDAAAPITFIFCPEDAGPAVLMHEFGHAVHDAQYPESKRWPVDKCEAFALLADINAERWKTLDSHEHEAFARHRLAVQADPVYAAALARAEGLRGLALKDQMDAIANDRDASSYPPSPYSLPVGPATPVQLVANTARADSLRRLGHWQWRPSGP